MLSTLGTLCRMELSAFLCTLPQRKEGEMWEAAGTSVASSLNLFWGRVTTSGVVATTEELHSDLPSGKKLLLGLEECS